MEETDPYRCKRAPFSVNQEPQVASSGPSSNLKVGPVPAASVISIPLAVVTLGRPAMPIRESDRSHAKGNVSKGDINVPKTHLINAVVSA
jgi:hypothetical protein